MSASRHGVTISPASYRRVAALPHIHPHRWRGLFFALALPACGGEFSSDPNTGAAGAAGDVDPGTGGSAAGAAGEASGGTPATGGGSGHDTGGSAGDAAGAPSGGQPTGGAAGSGGAPLGGAAGSGNAGSAGVAGAATEPSCAPEDAIVAPESFTWDGFSTRLDNETQSFCASSTGSICTLRNTSLAYLAVGRVDLSATLSCDTMTVAGVCGAESECDTHILPNDPAYARFFITPDGDGYRLVPDGQGSFGTFRENPSCQLDTGNGSSWSPSNIPTIDFRADFMAFMAPQRFPCP